jgi:2-polyprenyl-3-methyl-5-hydroxy-6-metoxy-1,4-benzoquinol methylase
VLGVSVKITGGFEEQGIVVGNIYDKYSSNNPIVRYIMQGFESSLSDLVQIVAPESIHEIGCGEGYWTLRWAEQGISVRGCDFSKHAIALAQENAIARGLPPETFAIKSIYDLVAEDDRNDLVVCLEVLEHLENPEAGLKALQRVVGRYLIVSVPREPIWCGLNLARGKYLKNWGNTPGHIQHWSKASFIKLISKYFNVVKVRSPLPWTMLLCQPRV